jgi:hypothetical protein
MLLRDDLPEAAREWRRTGVSLNFMFTDMEFADCSCTGPF